ncbi:WAP four-disulfide core domain protein 1 isoform X3 [Myotis myotis]|uniref:WAP four-disulfide core domain protein 1 isoform X3 n=1 Tax=Myotis myotis TaxID=51298 RepID=UPI001748200B|nr:WAP four-disulfide core domain protein 1 isoform X3 [Myotis myotis]
MIGGGAKRVWQAMHTPAPHLTGPPGKGALFSEHLERNPSTSCRMGSSRRKVIWVLCSLLLLLEASSAKNVWKRALHARLAEKPHAEEADSPRQPRADRCPPPPRSLPPGACEVEPCQADSQCRQRQRCCYNGCAYACLEAMPPPPVPGGAETVVSPILQPKTLKLRAAEPPAEVIQRTELEFQPVFFVDWLVEPKPRWLGGNGWLLDGPEEVLQAETCSTTEDGAEPLLCPSGYECHILSPGDMAKGIPNRGQCVKQGPAEPLRRQTVHKKYPEGDTKNVAEHGKGQQRHVQ